MSEPTTRREHPADHVPGLSELGVVLSGAIKAVGAHAGAVYLCEPDDSTLRMSVLAGVPSDLMRPWHSISLSAHLPVPDAIRERRLIWLRDGTEMANEYPRTAIILPYDFSITCNPLLSGEKVLGGFFTIGPPTRSTRPADRQRRALDSAAEAMVDRLERARELGRPIHPTPKPFTLRPPNASKHPGGLFAAMVERLPVGLSALDVNGRFTVVTDTAEELMGETRERLIGSRPWTVLPWLNDPVYEDRYRAAVISRVPSEFVALRPPDRWLSFQLHPDDSGISMVVSPTEVDWEGSEPPTQQTPTRTGVLYHILHLASALSEAASVSDVIDLVADEIMPTVGASALALFVHDQERRQLRLLGQRGFDAEFMERVDGSSVDARAPTARAAISGVPGFFRSLREMEVIYPSPEAYVQTDMEGWAFLPLVSSGRPVGACMIAFTRAHHFTVQERVVLNALGGLIAQALERARLYDLKLDLARGLQSGMLPHWLPRMRKLSSAACYLPGTEGMDIGGDFYDLVPLGPNTVAAVIGDVQGHSVAAAALMGQLRTAVLAYTTVLDGAPGEVLTQTNRLLCMMESELFASCVYLRLDMTTGQVRMARAGHPEPLISGPDGDRVLDTPEGLLLGIEPDAKYPELEFTLHPGSTLALYTDGLIEAPGIDLDDATRELVTRFSRVNHLPVDEAADELTSEVRAVPHRRDDIALMLLRAEPFE